MPKFSFLLSMCLIGGIGASYILMFESARKFVKMSAMLQESWQQCFPVALSFICNSSWSNGQSPPTVAALQGTRGETDPQNFIGHFVGPQFSRKVHNF